MALLNKDEGTKLKFLARGQLPKITNKERGYSTNKRSDLSKQTNRQKQRLHSNKDLFY